MVALLEKVMTSRAAAELTARMAGLVAGLSKEAQAQADGWLQVRTPAAFLAVERAIERMFQVAAGEVTGALLVALSEDSDFREEARRAAYANSEKKLRSGGSRDVKVRVLGGGSIDLRVDYLRPDTRGRMAKRSKKRAHGQRGKAGDTIYPLLMALGIHKGVTPAVASEVLTQVTDSDSVRSGRAALARRNLDLGHQPTLRLVHSFGALLVAQRSAWLKQAAANADLPAERPLAGKRVLVAIDGGRLRERKVKPGPARAATGHHRYDTPWREPKVFVICVLDEHGKVSEKLRPIYDGSLGDCDAIFEMLRDYLRVLGAQSAQELIVVADGAAWVWNRTNALAEALGLPDHRFHELIDWYHAVEKLGEVVALAHSYTTEQREAFLRSAKSRLHAGDIAGLMTLFDQLVGPAKKSEIDKHRPYFTQNELRMDYASAKENKLPIGSGVVESAIRRIVNMRIKAPGSFWLEENAESMLLLRSYLKAGRLDDLLLWSAEQRASWWRQPSGGPISEIQLAEAI